MKNKYSIYVVETNEKIKECLELYISSLTWLTFVGSSKCIENSIDVILELKPEILTINDILPMVSNAENLNKINKLNEYCKIYMVSGEMDNKKIFYSYKLGIRKYIKKPCDFISMFNIIQEDIIQNNLYV